MPYLSGLLDILTNDDKTGNGIDTDDNNAIKLQKQEQIRNFVANVKSTLLTSAYGYANDSDLGADYFQDHHVDPFRLAVKLGFNSFKEFLRSDHMKNCIDIDDSDGHTTYHYPLAEISRQKTDVHRAQIDEEFLDFNFDRKWHARRYRRNRLEEEMQKLLQIRYHKRMGIPLPEYLKPKKIEPIPVVFPYVNTRGRGRKNMMQGNTSKMTSSPSSTMTSLHVNNVENENASRRRSDAVSTSRRERRRCVPSIHEHNYFFPNDDND